jgi:hypothetical protein
MVLGKVRIGSLYLYKAFATNRLVTASCMVEVRRVCQETDGAFGGILVKMNLKWLAVDKRVMG